MMADRSGIEIDYCPKCRGVWLDRGELDKIIERTMQAEASAAPQPPQPAQPAPGYAPPAPTIPQQPYPPQQAYPQPGYGHHGKYDDDYYKKKKRKSLLGEIFDFD